MSGLSGRRLLAPSAYSEAIMPSLQLARSSRLARIIAKILLVLLVITIVLVAFAPWQQSVKGSGSVIAFAPDQRQQTIEAPIKGRIVQWGDGIKENAHVSKGQLIAEIQDIDPDLVRRLEEQLVALQDGRAAAQRQLEANQRNVEAIRLMTTPINDRLRSYRDVKEQVDASATAAIEGARNKVAAQQQVLAEAQAAEAQIRADYDRQETLFNENIVSEVKFQSAERKYREATAKVQKAREYILAAQNELKSKTGDREAKIQKAQVEIDYTLGEVQKQSSLLSKAQSDVAKSESELNKAIKALSEMETKVSRQRSQRVEAPLDGFLTQITPNSGTQVLKAGDSLCVIVPDTTDRSVQIWLDGNDAPLVEPGSHVRLQFEGWPAVQFAGWPSVAVGTFGGEVISVDATDNGKGKFRVFVKPDATDEKWPDTRYLRQGVRTNGWVLLKQVPLWFEIWRKMNGFPPVISSDAPDAKESKGDKKKPKLPKG